MIEEKSFSEHMSEEDQYFFWNHGDPNVDIKIYFQKYRPEQHDVILVKQTIVVRSPVAEVCRNYEVLFTIEQFVRMFNRVVAGEEVVIENRPLIYRGVEMQFDNLTGLKS